MPGARRSHQERELIFSALMMDMTLEELNKDLKEKGYREEPKGSWNMLVRYYKPMLEDHPGLIVSWIKHPPSLTEMKELKGE